MVSSFVVFTDTTVGLRRIGPHRAAALDPPGSRLISRLAARFRHKRPAAAGATRLARGPLRLGEGVVREIGVEAAPTMNARRSSRTARSLP
jgi:hypothetical protein